MIGLLLASSSCGTRRQTDTAAKPTTPRLLQGVTYRKSGGLAGMNEWVTISPDGHVQVSGRYAGEGDGELSAEQRRTLAGTFVGWNALKDEYFPDRPAADGMTLYIRYGTKGVTVIEPAEMPPQFRAAVTTIEGMTRGVARKR